MENKMVRISTIVILVGLAAGFITIYDKLFSTDLNYMDYSTTNKGNVVQSEGDTNMGTGTINKYGISLKDHEESLRRQGDELRNMLKKSTELSITLQADVVKERSINAQAVPDVVRQRGNIILKDKQSAELHNAKAKISVVFNSFSGKEFAKLTIHPLGRKPLSLPIYNQGQYLKFESKTGFHVAVVLSVDFGEKYIEVDVSKIN